MKKQLLLIVFIGGILHACIQKQIETYPAVIEIVGEEGISTDLLKQFRLDQNLQASVYQWKNHLLLYGNFPDLPGIQKQITAIYPHSIIRLYEKPFYVFDRRVCDNKEQTERWSHTIMTANLVADETMQQEYMDLHAAQTEHWPEVANGFCNAGFQQLLVFRNGRQLMLIISIPENENLDELNPKTTENNPRVNEWNVLMAKYQEGIDGAEAGETWVVFQIDKRRFVYGECRE